MTVAIAESRVRIGSDAARAGIIWPMGGLREDRARVEPPAVESAGVEEPGARPLGEGPRGEQPPRSPPQATDGERLGERLARWLLPGSNPAGAIYGQIAIGALLAAESGLHDTYLETDGSALLAIALYWLAHSYAHLLGRRLAARRRLTAAALGRALLEDWAIVRGAVAPLLALTVCWAAGASQRTGVSVALWTTAGSLLVYELIAGLRARARPAELVLEGCVGAAMGVGVLVLRVILQ
jgi:hypothetical protein